MLAGLAGLAAASAMADEPPASPSVMLRSCGARTCASIQEATVPRSFGGAPFGRTLAEAFRQPELLDSVETVLSGAAPEASVDFEAGSAQGRSYRAIIGRLERVGGGGEAAVMTLHDLTAIRRLDALRADFVANASHELRTPLASLVGFIETLEGPAKNDPEAQAKFLGIMREQTNRMTRLVQDLLSLSRIELDEHAPPGRTDDLESLVIATVAQLRPVAAARPAGQARVLACVNK